MAHRGRIENVNRNPRPSLAIAHALRQLLSFKITRGFNSPIVPTNPSVTMAVVDELFLIRFDVSALFIRLPYDLRNRSQSYRRDVECDRIESTLTVFRPKRAT